MPRWKSKPRERPPSQSLPTTPARHSIDRSTRSRTHENKVVSVSGHSQQRLPLASASARRGRRRPPRRRRRPRRAKAKAECAKNGTRPDDHRDEMTPAAPHTLCSLCASRVLCGGVCRWGRCARPPSHSRQALDRCSRIWEVFELGLAPAIDRLCVRCASNASHPRLHYYVHTYTHAQHNRIRTSRGAGSPSRI